MNKINEVLIEDWKNLSLRIKLLAIIGGIDTSFYLFTPILIASLWINISGLDSWASYFIFGIGLISTLFRAIKIGFMK